MTYREKLQQEHPESVGEHYLGGCESCPSDWGYEEECCFNNLWIYMDRRYRCAECWDRRMPDDESI